jgi:cytochrome c oxidase subunit 2
MSNSVNYSFGFSDPASNWMVSMIQLHDNIIFYLIIVFILVGWLLTSALMNKNHLRYLAHGNLIEVIWTCIPAAILWAIGLPS